MSLYRAPSPVLSSLLVGVLAPVAGSAPSALSAQVPPDDTLPVQIIRRAIQERWVHEDRHPDFVPRHQATEAVELRQIAPGLGRRYRSWSASVDRIDAEVVLDSVGRIRSLGVRPPPIRYSAVQDDPWGLRRSRIRRLQGTTEVLRLPSSRFRDLWLPLPVAPLAPGDTWSDTVSFAAEPGEGLRESYRAVRQHRVLRDTVIDGLSLPVIRTEAEVRYEASDLDVLLWEARRIERTLAGRTVGVTAVDTATGLRVAGVDTARWEGEAVLHDTVSGPWTSGVRYERMRTWTRYDSAGYRAFQDSLRAERARSRTGMLILPTAEIEERLEAGDSLLADSLIARWRETRDPAEVQRISRALAFFGRGGGWSREQWDSLRFSVARERGDTAAALEVVRQHMGARRRLTLEEAGLLLPYLEGPERLWRLGDPVRYDYGELSRMLLRASPIVEPDSAAWGCEPRACRLFLDRMETATESRLRDAALVGVFARDPARWYDRLSARREAGSALGDEAIRWGRGIPAEGGPPIPGREAGWRAWREWWSTGRGSRDSHRYALRLYRARTGRDAIGELAADWPPEGDSAQVAIGEILRALGAIAERTAEELRSDVLSGDSALIRRVQADLPARIRREGDELDARTVQALLPPLLDSIFVRGDSPWPPVEGFPSTAGRLIHPSATSSHGIDGIPGFLLTGNLPEAILSDLPAGVTAIAADEWEARDRRAGGHLFRFQPLRRWGPFLDVTWSWSSFARREPDEAPLGYAGGGSLLLVETGEGWRVVAWEAWIT